MTTDPALLPIPTLADVLAAQERIAPYLRPTALFTYPSLNTEVGTEVWVKHENHLPTGAFKVRGGINLISQLSEEERARGVIAASTGNHGQSIAYASKLFGVRATVFVPEGANPAKVESIRAFGAEVVHAGPNYDETRQAAEERAGERGYRYIHSGNEPLLIAGVATGTLEILADQPDIDAVIVPVGGGSGASGACVVTASRDPSVRVIAVQAEGAPAAYRGWKEDRLVSDPPHTFAEGLANGTSFALPQRILREHLDDFVLVSDDEIRSAQRLLIEKTRNLVEAAGAAALAAAIRLREELAGKKVAVVCSGGNVTIDQLRELLAG